jgi:type IV pilus assembly protein PilW
MTAPKLYGRAQRGFSLAELLVAMTIGLFILGGVAAVFVNLKSTFGTQDQLAQLQDSERLALTMLTTTIEDAGYYPDPVSSTAATSMPAALGTYGSMGAGQGLVGVTASGSDSITSRYVSTSGDGLMNCLGQTNTTGAKKIFLNTLFVDPAMGLMCSTDGGDTATTLVANVASLNVVYGTDTNGLGTAYSYLNAAAVTTANLWPMVRTVRLNIVFRNPYAAQAGQPQTITRVQTVSLMNQS